jgi:hypothetical protein
MYRDIEDPSITINAFTYESVPINYQIELSNKFRAVIGQSPFHSHTIIKQALSVENRFLNQQSAEEAILKFLKFYNFKIITQDLMPYV